jgi:hypothetical protein
MTPPLHHVIPLLPIHAEKMNIVLMNSTLQSADASMDFISIQTPAYALVKIIHQQAIESIVIHQVSPIISDLIEKAILTMELSMEVSMITCFYFIFIFIF